MITRRICATEDKRRMKTKKLLALILALLISLTGAFALAEGEVSEEEWAKIVEEESGDKKDGEWWNILLLGCDSYTKNTYSRSDSMIILSLNMENGSAKLTSLMRDTWIKVPGYKSKHRKLTELCAVGGPELTIRAINENFGMDIEHYALIGMEGIAEIIDIVGGLNLDITEAERKALNKGLFDLSSLSGMEELQQSGENVHLNGNQATAYARIRKIDSDYVRVERQRIVLLKMAAKIKDGANARTLLSIVNVLSDYVETNLSFMDIMSIGMAGLKMDLENVKELRLPADGTYESGNFDGVWCIKPNFSKNAKILKEFIYG